MMAYQNSSGSNCGCTDCFFVNKFELKSAFMNTECNPLVIYQADGCVPECSENGQEPLDSERLYPSGTIIAQSQSPKGIITLVVERADGTTQFLTLPPGSQGALNISSIKKVYVYVNININMYTATKVKFYFNIMQPIC